MTEEEYKKWFDDRKKMIGYDEQMGEFQPYTPYAGGSRYSMETITVKPGFKVWVDGGVIQYSLDICYAKHLNCSATCCLQSYCAPNLSDCTIYEFRPKSEVYNGILVVLMIVVGIPTCIMTVEFILNYKFCQKKDEQKEAVLGGMTICEAITWVCTCGKSAQSIKSVPDEYIQDFKEKHQTELSNPPPGRSMNHKSGLTPMP